MTNTTIAMHIVILLILIFFSSYITNYIVRNRYFKKLVHKEAQFNKLRFWLNPYFAELPPHLRKEARMALAEIIINNSDYEEIKTWYKFFFESKK